MQASSAHPLTRIINWLPVLLGAGVLTNFSLPVELPSSVTLGMGIALLVVMTRPRFRLCSLLCLMVLLGFAAAQWQTARVHTDFIIRPYFAIPMEATVMDIEPKGKRHSLILGEINAPTLPEGQRPHRVKVSAYLKGVEVRQGDRIKLRVMLIPPSPPVLKGAFDFAQYFYFRSIGAVGYALPPVKLLSRPQEEDSFNAFVTLRLSALRQRIQQALLEHLPQPALGIAVALVTGSMDSVTESANQALRNSSLSHMLSISGMHMVIVCGMVFFLVRLLLVCVPGLDRWMDPKRWAAFIALLSGAMYLGLADAPVPAVRAYVMVAIFLLAILCDREADALRSLALAASGVLLVQPSALMEPSFELSFAATLALILAFRVANPWFRKEAGQSLVAQFLVYIAASGFSSLVAGLATTPLTIYHFNQFVIYGVLANILAAPLLSFIITPALIVFLLLPWAWSSTLAADAANWGLEALVSIGEWVSSMPMAYLYVPPVPGWALVLLVGAVVLALFLNGKRKWLALLLAIPFILAPSGHKSPDLLIARDAKALAVRDGERWILLGGTARHFTVSLWQQRLGQEFIEKKRLKEPMPEALHCEDTFCLVTLAGKTYRIGNLPPEDCRGIDGFIEFTLKRRQFGKGKRVYPPMNLHCPQVPVLANFWKIVREGPLVITAKPEGILIETACDKAAIRPWVFYCSQLLKEK